MLKTIQSNAFKTNGSIRPAIQFYSGLNVVKGPDNFINSIGKSSFLMIIDFVFGGEDYVEKLTNIRTHVGNHEINFTFKFDEEYHFCRTTDNPNIVAICDNRYTKTSQNWSVNDFTKWLKSKYKIESKLSFRQIVSRFFRIYNRENLDELLPLRSFNNETESSSIESIIKLFDLYDPIEYSNNEAKDSQDRKDAFTEAQKFEYIPKITKTKYKTNLTKIEELENKKKELAEKSSKDLLDLDSEKASVALGLKNSLSTYKRQRSMLYHKLDNIKKDRKTGNVKYQADFSILKEFFPNVNEERLQTVESFHRDIKEIMSIELKDAEKDTWNLINLLNLQVKELETELEKVQSINSLSRVVLDEYSKIDKELTALKKENESYDKLEELNIIHKDKTTSLTEKTMIQASLLEGKLNDMMHNLNRQILSDDFKPPRITFVNPRRYTFFTPDDDGTGTNYKGMVLLDLACLSLTSLPAVVHDSLVLKNISKSSIEKIFELYNNFDKQVFISFDNVSSYSDRTIELVNQKEVLSLAGDENTLFGIQFGKNQLGDVK